jgi:uncharacterized protein YjbJ (UPF0337 family)
LALSRANATNRRPRWTGIASKGNWKQLKGKVKEQWGKLTDDDLDKMNGRRDQLEGKIQERYGLAKDMVRRDASAGEGRSENIVLRRQVKAG